VVVVVVVFSSLAVLSFVPVVDNIHKYQSVLVTTKY
jgi:hypothetical protein